MSETTRPAEALPAPTSSVDVTMVWRSSIYPPHGVRDPAKLETLRAAIEADGWQGRPLLVVLLHAGAYQAMTGSHRIAAAKLAGLDAVPCLVLDADEIGADLAEALDGCVDDDDRLALLRGATLDDAAELMAAEIEAAQ